MTQVTVADVRGHLVLQLGDRDVHDRDVEQGHRPADHHHAEDAPLVRVEELGRRVHRAGPLARLVARRPRLARTAAPPSGMRPSNFRSSGSFAVVRLVVVDRVEVVRDAVVVGVVVAALRRRPQRAVGAELGQRAAGDRQRRQRELGELARVLVGDVVVARVVVLGLLVVVVEPALDLLAVGHHQPAAVAHDDAGAHGGDRPRAVRQVVLVHVVEQRGEVLALHLAGDGEAHEGQERGRDVVGGGVPVDVVAGHLAVRMADQVRDLVRLAVRGRRRQAEEVVLAERDAVVAEHVYGGVDRRSSTVHQPPDPLVDRLDVIDVAPAYAIDVVAAEPQLHHAAVHRADAFRLDLARLDVHRRAPRRRRPGRTGRRRGRTAPPP